MPIMLCPAHASSANAKWWPLLQHNHHLIRHSQILLRRQGIRRHEFHQFTECLGLRLFRPDRKVMAHHNGNPSGVPQWIESVNQTPERPARPRTPRRHPTAAFAGVAQRVFALAEGSGTTGTPATTSERLLTAYDH